VISTDWLQIQPSKFYDIRATVATSKLQRRIARMIYATLTEIRSFLFKYVCWRVCSHRQTFWPNLLLKKSQFSAEVKGLNWIEQEPAVSSINIHIPKSWICKMFSLVNANVSPPLPEVQYNTNHRQKKHCEICCFIWQNYICQISINE
jgi:hypothetical protein